MDDKPFTNEELREDALKGLIFQAMGEVSMCWSKTPQGVFRDRDAIRIGNKLLEDIKALFA